MNEWVDIAGKFGIPVVMLCALGYFLWKKVWPLFEKQIENSSARLSEATKMIEQLAERVAKSEAHLAVLGTQVSPLWAAVQTKIAKDLTHPSPQFKEMDELLRRLENLTITDAEQSRLNHLLVERTKSTDPEVSEEEKASAQIMLGVMQKVKIEAQSDAPLEKPQLVGEKKEDINS